MNQPSAQNKGRPHHRNSLPTPDYSNTEAAFLDAMHAAKCAPSDGHVIADGVLHRFRVDGDKPNTKNGWYVLHGDGIPSGAFGSWKHGVNQTWSAKSNNELSRAERAEHSHRVTAARAAAEELQRQTHLAAAKRAASLWAASKPANNDHPYLVRKGIQPGFARQLNDALVLKIQDMNGAITGLQFIDPDGSKRMLSGTAKRGNFILVQRRDTGRLLICEGWATGQSLAVMFPADSVIAAIDSGNLQHVAVGFSKRTPDGEMVVCADRDEVGRKAGRAAAIASGAKLMLPNFPDDAPDELTDFNDLVAWIAGGSK
ncbi:MAG: toprim domain-containing protein [Halothiobacillaceae bacterium]|nr:toprim domain-containing protein [Halothiobacillaceae bacterium]